MFIELFKLSFFSITGRGIDLNYCGIEWFVLERNRDHSVVFETASNSAFQTLWLAMMATSFLLRDSCPYQYGHNGHLSEIHPF